MLAESVKDDHARSVCSHGRQVEIAGRECEGRATRWARWPVRFYGRQIKVAGRECEGRDAPILSADNGGRSKALADSVNGEAPAGSTIADCHTRCHAPPENSQLRTTCLAVRNLSVFRAHRPLVKRHPPTLPPARHGWTGSSTSCAICPSTPGTDSSGGAVTSRFSRLHGATGGGNVACFGSW